MDSGFGSSLTQLIDEQINYAVKENLKDWKNTETTVTKNMNDKSEQHKNLIEDRDKNVIIHGQNQSDKCDSELVKEILEATAATCKPTHLRLGQRRDDKVRPIMLRMKTKDDKENFMSKLWMLKNVRKRFGNISITNDYTLEKLELDQEMDRRSGKKKSARNERVPMEGERNTKNGITIDTDMKRQQ